MANTQLLKNILRIMTMFVFNISTHVPPRNLFTCVIRVLGRSLHGTGQCVTGALTRLFIRSIRRVIINGTATESSSDSLQALTFTLLMHTSGLLYTHFLKHNRRYSCWQQLVGKEKLVFKRNHYLQS